MEKYFDTNRYLMTFLGHWPDQTSKERIIIRILGNTLMITANIPSVISMYKVRDDFDAVVEAIPMVITGFLYFSEFITLVLITPKMVFLWQRLRRDVKLLQGYISELSILEQATKEGSRMIKLYSIYMCTSTFFYCLYSLLPPILDVIAPLNETRPKIYIYNTDYIIFDKEKYFYFVYVHSFTAGLYCIGTIVGYDLMLLSFTQHACGMFRVLGFRLENIEKLANKKISKLPIEDRIYNQAVECLTLYRDIIEYAETIEDCFSASLLISTGICTLIMTFQGVMIVIKIDDPDFVSRFATYFIAQGIHLYYNCMPGQQLVNHSSDLYKYLYFVNWYELPLKTQKLLLIMMMRSSRECNITIGKLFVLSMEYYSSVMKTVFSYLSVLMSMRK